jgi:hypothetical protein
MRPALDPVGHRVPRTKPTCLLHTWRPHQRRPFTLVLHLRQHQSSRNLHLQILSQELDHTTLSITHHTRKRPSTGPRTTHGPQSWSKEVHRLDITCVHRDIPKDPTLSAEERRHPLTPHLVVLPIEVWRTRTPFLVCHLWILDWLESIKTRTGSDTN